MNIRKNKLKEKKRKNYIRKKQLHFLFYETRTMNQHISKKHQYKYARIIEIANFASAVLRQA